MHIFVSVYIYISGASAMMTHNVRPREINPSPSMRLIIVLLRLSSSITRLKEVQTVHGHKF